MGGGPRSGLPTPHSTKSFWQTEPSEVLTGHRTTPDLPARADVVIIGSGITGAFAARGLVAGGKSVLMLEAREACWGATSRNGGHCQPLIYSTRPHVARFELDCYRQIEHLIEEHNIPCDWRRVGGVHALPTQEWVDLAAKSLARLRREHPDLADKAELYTDESSLEDLRVLNATGAVLQPYAAKCWPYKLVAWILETLLEDDTAGAHGSLDFNLQTWTPVTQLREDEGSGMWEVCTSRGSVVAGRVLLATNAYTSHLMPAFADLIVPVQGQVAALETPTGNIPLQHSHVWLPGDSDNYLIERDGPRGPMILGGERMSVPSGGEGVWRDDTINEKVAKNLRRSLHPALKLLPDDEPEPEELKADYEWTGIMGYSKDNHPWVGLVPLELGGGRGKNLWVCAGYTGHGMPLAARSATAVVDMMLGKDDGVEIPREFVVTRERAERAKGLTLGGASVIADLRDLVGEMEEA